jgi:hypothetical protein
MNEGLLKRIDWDYRVMLSWLIGILMGLRAEDLATWVLFILFSLGLWVAFSSIEKQIMMLQREIEALHKKNSP